jgi:predicted SAM-dependent methyltransferase
MKGAKKAFFEKFVPVKFRSRLKTTYRRFLYFGCRYKCPFCNSRFRAFLPFGFNFHVIKKKKIVGSGYRQNARCPICGSMDRERLIYLYLLLKTDIFEKPKKLLHVAPEKKLKDKLQSEVNIDYLTADISTKNVIIKMDITDIKFPDDSFDAIICNHVLEHIIDDSKAISELYRALKPGGWAILQVPVSLTLKETYEDTSITNSRGREEAFGQKDHVRIYAEDYQDRLEQAGFRVNVFKWVADVDNFGGQRNVFGLDAEEKVYFVRKRG